MERDEDRSTPEELEWALADERLAQDPAGLEHLLGPALDSFLTTGRVPGWCGVDLLRGWAFYLVRDDAAEGREARGARRHPFCLGGTNTLYRLEPNSTPHWIS